MAVVDRYSHFVLSHLEAMNKTSSSTLQDFVSHPPPHTSPWGDLVTCQVCYTLQFNAYSSDVFHSTPAARTDLFNRTMSKVHMTDFFGGVSSVELAPLPPGDAGKADVREPEAMWEVTRSRWDSSERTAEDSFTQSQPSSEDNWHKLSAVFLLTFTFSAHFLAAYCKF